jgi:hypothetical protein
LAGLARANPDDPEIAKFMHLLPKKRIPNLPSTPMEAIKINQAEDRKRPVKERSETEQSVAPRRRRRYHASVPIDQVKVPMAR